MSKDQKLSTHNIDQLGLYEKVSQTPDSDPKKCTSFWKFIDFMLNFKGYLFALLAAFFFCTGMIVMKKANEFIKLSGFDHLVIFYVITLLVLPGIVVYRKENLLGAKGQRVLLLSRSIFQVLAVICLYNGMLILLPSDAAALGNTSIIFTAIIARIFLKEKLGIIHLIAIVFTITGVLFISKPSFLSFDASTDNQTTQINEGSSSVFNGTINQTSKVLDQKFASISPETLNIMGIVLIILSAFFLGSVAAITKQTSNEHIHWAVVNLNTSYIGLPLCLLLSGLFYYFGINVFNEKASMYVIPIFISTFSAILKLLGFVCSTLAFKYEDATKVTIVKKLDLALYIVLQATILNLTVDTYSIIGSVFLVTSNLVLMGHKILKVRMTKQQKQTSFSDK